MKNNKNIAVIITAKKGGLFVNAEVTDPKSLEALINRPATKGSITRVASVMGTRPGPCILYWKDESNKTVNISGRVL